jgi:hypothetical protein
LGQLKGRLDAGQLLLAPRCLRSGQWIDGAQHQIATVARLSWLRACRRDEKGEAAEDEEKPAHLGQDI